MRKLLTLTAALVLCAAMLSAQGNTAALSGTVSDQTGAAVPGAEIEVMNVATSLVAKTTGSERGEWSVPSLPAGTYKVTVTKPGFKAATVPSVVIEAGVPASIPVRLEVGQATETINVTAGADIVQSATAEVSNTMTGRQLTDLPFTTRNAVELLVNEPGTATPTTPRSSSINGLPKGALNVTIDGMNSQDNMLKSSDGFFSYLYTPVDAVDEVTMTSSAAGVDATSQGAAQIKFITRSGSNQFHGGVFWQVRNTDLDANYYFNNQIGTPRDVIKLNQGGFHVGGPVLKNKLFFFTNYELYKLPATQNYKRTILSPAALQGNYQYTANGQVNSVNLYSLAAAANPSLPSGTRAYPTTPDPILLSTFNQIQQLAAGGIVTPNASNGDYSTQTLTYQPNGKQNNWFSTSRLDYNVTQKHSLSLVYNYDYYLATPDFLNNVVPAYPNTGTVLGTNVETGQRSNRFGGTLTLRSSLTARLTNEWRGSLNGGSVLFFDALNDGLYSMWRGFIPTFSGGTGVNALSGVTTSTSAQRRNTPTKEIADTVSWVRGSHQFSFGGNWDQVNAFQSISFTSVMPQISMGIVNGDPIITGATNIFSAANFPGATQNQLNQAEALYADLTGRVNTITSQVAQVTQGNYQFGTPTVDRDQIREFGLFASDTWRALPSLTIYAGLRVEKQGQFVNTNNLYNSVGGIAGIYGISGVGHLFQPGVLDGQNPTLTPISQDPGYSIPARYAPSVGVAYQLPGMTGVLGAIFGHHNGATVIRGGYNISTVREGFQVFVSSLGANPGISVSTTVSNATFPQNFGPAGSVQFSDPSLPTRPPSLPPTLAGVSLYDFDPHLKLGYAQSWNIGVQRELSRNTVLEVRYTGNHGTDLWRLLNLNETNIFENGFLTDFQNAQNNLTIARNTPAGSVAGVSSGPTSINFGNQGLPGQKNLSIIPVAIGSSSDTTTANNLVYNQAGTLAVAIDGNTTRMNNLIKAGFPVNMFQVNPATAGASVFILNNTGSSYYDAGQVELRRRLAAGLQIDGSYVFSKALSVGATNSSSDNQTAVTIRNLHLDKGPSAFDIRNAIKFNSIYELPFGAGKAMLNGMHNGVVKQLVSGWQLAGVVRLQSGTPLQLTGLATTTQNATSGVVLHNISLSQLQSEVGIYKTSYAGPNGGKIYYLPPPTSDVAASTANITSANNTNLITNSQAAFGVNGLSYTQVNPNAPYIGPTAAGQVGCICYLYLPWQRHFDLSLTKHTRIKEKVDVELRVQALDVLNLTNFLPNNGPTSATFAQVTTAYRDINGTVDPGSRIIEFVLRVNF
ncbi:MAG TPA: carboxypeptidase-like regulatory domain-containing protein [Bryobacteraceae bacterium]|nr:carboxypeptidase-like regulatory domain-containing protein [Bryobacteraceae bacterium]